MLVNWNHIKRKHPFVTDCLTHQTSQHFVQQSSVFQVSEGLRETPASLCIFEFLRKAFVCLALLPLFPRLFLVCGTELWGWADLGSNPNSVAQRRYGCRPVPYPPQTPVSSSVKHRWHCLLCWFALCRDNVRKDGRKRRYWKEIMCVSSPTLQVQVLPINKLSFLSPSKACTYLSILVVVNKAFWFSIQDHILSFCFL